MSLRAQVKAGVNLAFNKLGDLVKKGTYQSLTGNVTRDLVAGTSTAEMVSYPLKRIVFTKFEEKENDKDVNLLTDEKMLFPSGDLPVQPKSADTVLDSLNRTWEIVRLLSDPADSLTILHVRTSR